MNDTTAPQMDEQELLVERAHGKLAAYAALGSAAAILIAVALYVMAFKDADIRSKVALLTSTHDHSAQLILSSLFRTVSFALLAFVLGFLALAAKRRMPELPRATVPVAHAGPALLAIASPLMVIAQIKAAKDFTLAHPQNLKAAEAALDSSLVTITQYVTVFASMLTAVSWAIVGLFSLRSGLLTRMMGGVAIAVGVLCLISVYGPSVLVLVIQFFWLTALAVMLLATEETRPPAWNLGTAVSWREVDAARRDVALEQQQEQQPDDDAQ